MMNRNRYSPFQICYPLIKRLGDIFASLLLLLIASPLLIIVAIWIKVSSHGGVFFSQVRTGRNNHQFRIYKFRTMLKDSENCGPLITSGDDARITPFGRILRRTKMDELPQLFNVLKGDMSLVGPRPQVPKFTDQFGGDNHDIILHVRPGITGPTQLRFRNEEEMLAGIEDREAYYICNLLPVKCKMDVDYVENRNFSYDVHILFKTIGIFLNGVLGRSSRSELQPQFSYALTAKYTHPRTEPSEEPEVVATGTE